MPVSEDEVDALLGGPPPETTEADVEALLAEPEPQPARGWEPPPQHAETPEAMAKAIELERKTQVPWNIARHRPKEFEESWQAGEFDPATWGKQYPEMRTLVEKDPRFYKIVTKDKPLGLLSKALNAAIDVKAWVGENTPLDAVENALGFNPIGMSPLGLPEQAIKRVYDFATGEDGKTAAQKREAERVHPTTVSYLQNERTEAFEKFRADFPIAAELVAANERFKEAWAGGELNELYTQLGQMRAANEANATRERLGLPTYGGGDTSELEAEIERRRLAAVQLDWNEGELGRALADVGQAVASSAGTYEQAGPIALGLAGLGAAAGAAATRTPAGALQGAQTLGGFGLKLGVAYGSFRQEFGSTYAALLGKKTEDGHEFTEAEARGTATAAAAVKSVIETAGTIYELAAAKNVAQALAGTAEKAAADAAGRTVLSRLARGAGNYAIGSLAEGLEEGSQEGTDQIADYVLSSVVDRRWQSRPVLNRDAIAESFSAGVIGGVGLQSVFGLGQLSLGALGEVVGDTMRRDESAIAERQVAAIAGLSDSLTAQASPDAVADIIAGTTAKGGPPVTHMHVDAQALVRHFQSENKDPNEGATELLGEDGAKHLQEAINSGGRVEVPVAKYVETWVPSGVAAKLAKDTTTRAGLDTGAEAAARTKEEADLTKHLVEQAEAEAKGEVSPETDVGEAAWAKRRAEELVAAGKASGAVTSMKEALVALAPVRAALRTIASRSGKTLEQMFGDLRLPIQGEQTEELDESDFVGDADESAGIDYVGAQAHIDRMQSPEKQAAYRAWLGYARRDVIVKPDVPDEAKRELARFGVWPEGEPVDFDEAGRSMRRTVGKKSGGGAQPEALAKDRFEKRAPGMVAQYGYIPGTIKKSRYGQPLTDVLTDGERAERDRPSEERLREEFGKAESKEQARRLFTDSTSGLHNERSWKRSGYKGPLVAIRIGAIKAINDAHSHEDADAYIQEVARVAAKHSPDAARVGGDILVPNGDAAAIRKDIEAVPALRGMPIEFGAGENLEAATAALNKAIEERKAAKDDSRWPERGELPAALEGVAEVPFTPGPAAVALPDGHAVGRTDAEQAQAFETVNREADTGAWTKDGFDTLQRINPKAHTMTLDLNGLRVVHDVLEQRFGFTKELARAFGDRIILEFTKAAMASGGKAFDFAHISGDEYIARGDDKTALAQYGKKLEEVARTLSVGAIAENGEVVRYGRFEFGRGIGGNRRLADRALNRHKERLTRQGRRGDTVEAAKLERFASVAEMEAAVHQDRRQDGVDGDAGRSDEEVADPETHKQEEKAGVRGFTEITRTALERYFRVVLTSKADKTTFLHESAHVFFELLADAAERPDAPEGIRDDYAAILKWAGADSRKDVKTEHHEKFARAWERYLAEGKAPSAALVGAFQRFKLWITNVYKTLSKLGDLNDEVRGIFDRLLATDAEIAAARRTTGFDVGAFRTIEESGMTPEEWRDYLRVRAAASSNAAQAAARRVLADKLRETEDWWRAEEDALLEAADKAYDELPAQRARAALQGVELDREAVAAAVGEAAAERFKTASGAIAGESADEFADLHGFPTGEAMLKAVAALPSRESWTRSEARRQMEERHPDIANDIRRMRALAEKRLQTEPFTARTLVAEWAALRKKAGLPPTAPIDAVRNAAKQIAAGKTIGRLNVGNVLAQERSAAEKCAKAVATGNYEQAATFKQQQLLNMFLHGALTEARDERDAFLERATRASKPASRAKLGKAGPVYRDGVDLLLESFGLAEPREREDPLPSLAEVIGQMESDGATVGFDVDAVTRLLARPGYYRELKVSEMRQLDEALRNIQGAARAVGTALIDGKRQDKAETVAKLVAEGAANLESRGPATSSVSAETLLEKAGGLYNSFSGSLLKPEVVADWLGGGDINSTWFRAIVKPLQDAKAAEADLLNTTIKPVVDAFEKMPAAVQKTFMAKVDGAALFPTHRKDISPPTRRFELLTMAMHAGNASNLRRLLEGRSISHEQLRKALDLLTKEEMDWVQSIWDANESLWAPSADLEERQSGLRPEKLKRVPLVTRHGTYAGGYVPAVYDRRVTTVGQVQEGAAIAALMDPSFTRPGTSRSHLKSRAQNFADVLSLEPTAILSHLQQAAHDIAFREAIQSVGGLIMNPEVQATLRERIGEGRAKQMLQWVKDVGQMRGADDVVHASAFYKAMRAIRANTVVSALGYAIPNAIEDVSNLPAAIARTDLKANHLAAATAAIAASPNETVAFVDSKSGEMRTRRDQLTRELGKRVKKLSAWGGAPAAALRAAREHAFVFMEMSDKMTSTPVWLGRYRQALADGASDADAVTLADRAVRQVFPSHSPVDAAPILRDKNGIGLGLLFYGFLSTYYNGIADLTHQFGRADGFAAKARMGGRLMAYVACVSVLSEFLRGRGKEPDEEWAEWFARKFMVGPISAVPYGGDVSNLIEGKLLGKRTNPRVVSMIGVLDEFVKAAVEAGDDEKDLDKRLTRLARAAGPLFGIPGVGQGVRTGAYAEGVASGDIDVRNPADAAAGAIYGEREGQPANPLRLAGDVISGE